MTSWRNQTQNASIGQSLFLDAYNDHNEFDNGDGGGGNVTVTMMTTTNTHTHTQCFNLQNEHHHISAAAKTPTHNKLRTRRPM
jgi:hypothetical protein